MSTITFALIATVAIVAAAVSVDLTARLVATTDC